MMSDHDHDLTEPEDPLDEFVRAARPRAPSRLAPAVLARARARRGLRAAAIGGATLLAAAAALLVWLHHAGEPPVASVPGPSHGPAVAPWRDAGPPPSPVVPQDAGSPGWSDAPALLDDVERENRAAIAACLRLEPGLAGRAMATFRTARRPDGSSFTDLVIHHSLGYLGYSDEERCLQKLVPALALPPLPEGVDQIAFTLAPLAVPPDGDEWRDPVQTGRALLAPIAASLTACVHDPATLRGAVAVFEPSGGPYRPTRTGARVQIVLADHASTAARRCVAHEVRAVVVPALPERLDQIVLALPLAP